MIVVVCPLVVVGARVSDRISRGQTDRQAGRQAVIRYGLLCCVDFVEWMVLLVDWIAVILRG